MSRLVPLASEQVNKPSPSRAPGPGLGSMARSSFNAFSPSTGQLCSLLFQSSGLSGTTEYTPTERPPYQALHADIRQSRAHTPRGTGTSHDVPLHPSSARIPGKEHDKQRWTQPSHLAATNCRACVLSCKAQFQFACSNQVAAVRAAHRCKREKSGAAHAYIQRWRHVCVLCVCIQS